MPGADHDLRVVRWRSGLAALAVSAATVALVVLDVVDDAFRTWWVDHALTSATVTGLLVLLVTVLVVDQVTDLRQARTRSRAVAAQAAIVLGQALRSSRSVGAAFDGTGERDAAGDDVRNYLVMLLVSAPVLIDTRVSRAFLEEAQRLGVELTRVLRRAEKGAETGADRIASDALVEATDRLRAAAGPLVGVLQPAERSVVTGDEES